MKHKQNWQLPRMLWNKRGKRVKKVPFGLLLFVFICTFLFHGIKIQANAAGKEEKILVAYFSRAGENYSVGVVEKGNTRILAETIASQLGDADLFEIASVNPYPDSYEETTKIAKTEKEQHARPKLTATVDNFDDYDVIFVGYPIWHADMPMPVYTFLESYDFSGKKVVPFCTHAGSGLASTQQTITKKLSQSEVLTGLAVIGSDTQNNPSETEQSVASWLEHLKINNSSGNVAGDVNADGKFNLSDVVLLQKWLFVDTSVTLLDWKAADFYADDVIDICDLILMKRRLILQ